MSRAEELRAPDVIYCPVCKTSFERPKNQWTCQCPNEKCRAMVVVNTPTFVRSQR